MAERTGLFRVWNARRIALTLFLVAISVLIGSEPVLAGCGPDYIIAGSATYKGTTLTAADLQYTVNITLNDIEIDSYQMGSNTSYGDYFVLFIPTEDGAGDPCSLPTGTKYDQYFIYINGDSVEQNPISIEDIDEATRQKIIDISVK